MRFFALTCALLFVHLSVISSEGKKCEEENGYCSINDEHVPKGSNVKGEPPKVDMLECKDRMDCSAYVAHGECQRNPGWMIINW